MSATANSVVKAEKVWMDGKLVAWNDANVHVMTHALHYGLGVFEGIRAYRAENGKLAIFKLREHIRRFLDSAHIIILKIPYTEDELMQACIDVLASQEKLFPNGAYLRPVAFMGDGAMGLGAQNETRVAITAWEWGTYLGDKGVKEGIRAKVSSFTRMHVNVNMVRGKISGQYVNSILAKREAVMGGYDEAILLDISGFVAEASGENIFCVGRHGVVRTPSLSSPILRGITRDTVIKLLRDAGHPVEEVSFTRDALYIAGEVFFTGTAAEITPVREVDNRQVGEGKPGAITQMVQQTYARVVRGGEPAYLHWLTFV
ncbi:MAG: branched chain amino acid aminotransferase [Archangium gephyra]|uniref:Branched-chain-amino-acid aminotransferase n=1 Tax=Archangium gephyra TaxID=48 RepID=A0A2W5TED9_9BACT|nr:MAG: branched chain amino acid aminotransferase [Archangium gephyra]